MQVGRRRRWVITLLLVLASVTAAFPGAQTAAGAGPAGTELILVTFRPWATAADKDAVGRAAGGRIKHDLGRIRTRVTKVPAAAKASILSAYARSSSVERAAPAIKLGRASVPDDPGYPQQWALPKIGWDTAKNSVNVTGSATIAVLDTGVDAGHPDLAGRVTTGISYTGGSANSDPNGGAK